MISDPLFASLERESFEAEWPGGLKIEVYESLPSVIEAGRLLDELNPAVLLLSPQFRELAEEIRRSNREVEIVAPEPDFQAAAQLLADRIEDEYAHGARGPVLLIPGEEGGAEEEIAAALLALLSERRVLEEAEYPAVVVLIGAGPGSEEALRTAADRYPEALFLSQRLLRYRGGIRAFYLDFDWPGYYRGRNLWKIRPYPSIPVPSEGAATTN